MFKFVQDGRTVYQAQPCPGAATQQTIKSPSASPATAASPTDLDATIEFMSTYRACADAISMWRDEMAPLYETWRGRHADAVARIEKDPQLQARFQQRVQAKRGGKASLCRPVGLELRGVKS